MSRISYVDVHPLAITCVCDHYTRVQVGGSREPSSAAVVGMLFGKGDDVGVTIVDATDAVYNSDGPGSTSFNMVEMAKKIQLWTTMDENRATKMLGWYSFGLVATAEHLKIHSKMTEFGEDQLFLLMDPNPNPLSNDASFTIYRSCGDGGGFVVAPYKLQTVEAERVAVDQVVKSSISQTESAEHGLLGLSRRQSVLALQVRIDTIISVMMAIDRGSISASKPLLRRIAKICDSVPLSIAGNDELLMNDMVSALSAAVLSSIAQSTAQISELNNKNMHAYSERHNLR